MLILGNLRYNIELYELVTIKDEFGYDVENYILKYKLKAEKKEISGNYGVINNENFHSTRIDFSIHYRKGVNERMKLMYNNKEYRINFIKEIGFKEGLILECDLVISPNSDN